MSAISDDIDHVTYKKGCIVFHLTPLGLKNHIAFNRRWNAEQRRIKKANARYEREQSREMARDLRRVLRQRRELMRWLKAGKPQNVPKHKCSACGKIRPCKQDRDNWFCGSCVKLSKNKKEIEFRCPRHKDWCGGRYGSCAGCMGASYASCSLI